MATEQTPSEVVVVTGAGGMGRAIARRIGSGRSVVLADFDEANLASSAEMLRADGHQTAASSRPSVDRAHRCEGVTHP